MSYLRGRSGYYKGQHCRSLGEFHVALWIDLFDHGTVAFRMEPFKMIGISGIGKIPDIVSIDKSGLKTIWEIKHNDEETVAVEELYKKEFSYLFNMDNIKVKFVNSSKFIEQLRYAFSVTLGKESYKKYLREYRDTNIHPSVGFPGSLNPMFGKSQKSSTRLKIKTTLKGKMSGSKNPNFGNHLSPAPKVRIGAKWKDQSSKNNILITSLTNRLEKLSFEDYDDFIKLCMKSFSTGKYSKPIYMNGIIKVTEEKVLEVFGSFDNFWSTIRIST